MAVQITTTGNLSKGAAVFESSTGVKLAVLYRTTDDGIAIYSDIDGTPSVEDSDTPSTIFGGGVVAQLDAEIDSNDNIHIIAACSADQTRDIAYAIATYSGGSWTLGSWELVASYTDAVASAPGVSITIDSNDKPHAAYVDGVTSKGATADVVYYTEKTGASWSTPYQISARDDKADGYNTPRLSIKSSDDAEIFYYGATSGVTHAGNPVYRWRGSGVWDAPNYYSESAAVLGLPGLTIKPGVSGHYYHRATSYIEDNNVSTGYSTATGSRQVSPYRDNASDTRYVLYIDSSNYVHIISNDGGGWTDGGAIQSGDTYTYVIAGWQFNNLNNTGSIDYIFAFSTNIYWDEHSLGGTPTLTAASGTIGITGQATGLYATRLLTAAYGTRSLTGQTAAFAVATTMPAAYGTITIAGQAAALYAAHLLTAALGTASLAGQDTVLLAARLLAATFGTRSLSGQAADLISGIKLSASNGTIALSGRDAGLLATFRLSNAQGTISLLGRAANLTFAHYVLLSQGNITIQGNAISFSRALIHTAQTGTLTLDGQPSSLAAGLIFTAAQGALNLTGQAAALARAVAIAADLGAITITGQAAGLILGGAVLPAAYGTIVLAGQAAGFTYNELVTALVTITALARSTALTATDRSISLTAIDQDFTITVKSKP